jgi:hypothetical protein
MSDEGPLQPPAPDVATEFVQEQSIANKKRLEESDAKTRKRNLEELTRIAEDPERARQFLLRTSMIVVNEGRSRLPSISQRFLRLLFLVQSELRHAGMQQCAAAGANLA